MPTITGVTPISGFPSTGISIAGSGLGAAGSTAKVNFANPVETVVINGTVNGTATAVTATVPPLPSPGVYNVSVTVGTSTSNVKPFYYVGAPTCSALTPATGEATPTGPTTITGTGFAGVANTAVLFGATAAQAAGFTVTGDTTISATPPAATFTGSTDTVDVTITNAGGASTVACQFTYYNPATVTAVSPNTGGAPNQAGVLITGTNFVDVSAVNFATAGDPTGAANPATITSQPSDTQLVITTPPGLAAATTYEVRVTTPGGQSALNPPNDNFATA